MPQSSPRFQGSSTRLKFSSIPASPAMTATVPDEFICPITSELMIDPLMTRSGRNFERSAILEWISNHQNTCPMTRQPLRPSDLIPNRALQGKIRAWCVAHDVEAERQIEAIEGSRSSNDVFLTFVAPTMAR